MNADWLIVREEWRLVKIEGFSFERRGPDWDSGC